ncbi:sec1 family domain-containing protein 2-like [Tachypleus tridentatus]|uniref:sec1 family domain-containing protein 2-like n=1 Tax=Tachypleus tridentatus TaxID=6853 RepID=UPI003FD2AF61
MSVQTNLPKVLDHWWTEVCYKVKKSVVYLDNPAAECLHWHGGLLRLLDAGALHVRQLSSFETGSESERKAVFVVSGPLYGEPLHIIQDILKYSSFQYSVVITSFSPSHHDNKQTYYSVEDRLLEWMGDMNYTAEVIHIPIFAATVCDSLFLTPGFSKLFPLLGNIGTKQSHQTTVKHGEDKDGGTLMDNSVSGLSFEYQLNLKGLVDCLNSLLELLHLKEDIFTLGMLSRLIGTDLEHSPLAKQRRKSATTRACFLLVDRTLDLAGPLSHETDSLFDRIVRVLPQLPGHTCDVAVDMCSLTSCLFNDTVYERPIVAPGCLANKSTDLASTMLNKLVTTKQKECLMEMNRCVVEVATREGIPVDLSEEKLTVDQLNDTVCAFRSHPEAVITHSEILQQALAVTQALNHPKNSQMEELLSTEKLLIQNTTISGEGPTTNLLRLIENRREKSLTLEDVVILMAQLFALCGENVIGDDKQKTKLQAAFVEAIFHDAEEELPEFLRELVGETVQETSVISAVKVMFEKLHLIGRARQDLKKYRSVLHKAGELEAAVYIPLLRQLIDDVFNPIVSELPDVEFLSKGLTDSGEFLHFLIDLTVRSFGVVKRNNEVFLKYTDNYRSLFEWEVVLHSSGTLFDFLLFIFVTSLFMNVSKHQPRDHPVLIVFVVGGVTAAEVRQIREIVAKYRPSTEVIVGSTRLVQPKDVLKMIFKR